MDVNEKPSRERFWTWDMIALLGLNVVFLGVILAGLWLVIGALYPSFLSWLKHVIHI